MTELHDTPGTTASQEIPVPEGLEQRLSALIDKLEATEQARQQRRRHTRSLWSVGLATAAIFAAAAFLLLAPPHSSRIHEIDDPEEARQQTERALKLLSTTFAKGVAGVEQAEHTTAHIIRHLNH